MKKFLTLAGAVLACSLAAAASPELNIHWPQGFTPQQADLFDHSELSVGAPCATVWQTLVDAQRWPDWYPNSSSVRLERGAELAAGRGFQWRTFGLEVASQVHEFVPQQRLGWFGHAKDLDAYHTWLLLPQGQGCLVVTEEVVRGPGAVSSRKPCTRGTAYGWSGWPRKRAGAKTGRAVSDPQGPTPVRGGRWLRFSRPSFPSRSV